MCFGGQNGFVGKVNRRDLDNGLSTARGVTLTRSTGS